MQVLDAVYKLQSTQEWSRYTAQRGNVTIGTPAIELTMRSELTMWSEEDLLVGRTSLSLG